MPTPPAASSVSGAGDPILAIGGSVAPASDSSTVDLYAVNAPEFPPDLEWLNTEQPLSLASLRGKIVLLDFWTYGCINCLHNFPEIKRLQQKYAETLVVIGVHSAKFTHEGQTENIRQVILRYGLDYPIVNDRALNVWNAWNVQAWPTLVVIDPSGNVAGLHVGEGVFTALDPLMRLLVRSFDARGSLDHSPLPLKLERDGLPQTVLAFPANVAVDPASGLIYIADTNHHRIVVARADGEVTAVIGGAQPGWQDGDLRSARFRNPHGLVLSADGRTLYVADTENHIVRAVDLPAGAVSTFAGNGTRLSTPIAHGADRLAVQLSSPWDLAFDERSLYVAMPGVHQIWRIDLDTGVAEPHIGTGVEGVRDGLLREAELAQTSALALGDGGILYFADPESSAIRRGGLDASTGEVSTLAGGRSLYAFGDVDGAGDQARLQHPLGLAYADGVLYVADTYNNKIKSVDPATAEVRTLWGSTPGWRDGSDPLFYEPGGIAAAAGILYVADTNNHAVRMIDLDTLESSTLVLKGIQRFAQPSLDGGIRTVRFGPTSLYAGPGAIVLDIRLPSGYKLNPQAPFSMAWNATGADVAFPPDATRSELAPLLPLTLTMSFAPGSADIVADLTTIYCEVEKESICLIDQARLLVPVNVEAAYPGVAAANRLMLQYAIEAPVLEATQ
jgi:DNA-binding beta-propeller fold protein YncE